MFDWSTKPLFNFKPIANIKLSEIDTLVINVNPGEQEENLNSIIHKGERIRIEQARYWRKDADSFIDFLKNNCDAAIKDSWDMLQEKGMLRPFYYVILTILILGASLPTYWIITNGIDNIKPQRLLLLVGSYITLIPYWLFMKRKLK